MPRGRRATSRQGGPTRKSARQAESSSIHQEQLPRRGIRRPRSVSRPSPEAIATDLSGSEVEFSSAPVVALERVSESNDAGELDQLEDSPEQRAARAQDIFDFDLPKFSKWCEKVYDVLGSMDSSVPSADAVKRLAVDKRMYDAARRPFVEEAALCIDPDSLPDELSPEQTSKARITIFAGNLVSLALSVFRLRHGHEESLPTLQQLDDSFPVLFDPHFEEYSEDMKEESFGLAFQIRCRRLAETLSADPSKDCLVQAAVIFCEESVAGSKEALRVLTQGPYKQLAGISVDENIVSQEAYQNPLNGLIKRISGHSSEARASLDEAFPEEELYQALWDWMKKTWGHLNSMAMPKGSQEVLRPSVSAVRPEEEPALFESQPLDAAGGSVSGSGSGSDSGTDNGGYEQLQNTDPGRIFSDGRYALAAAKESEHKATLVPAIRGINPRRMFNTPVESPPPNDQRHANDSLSPAPIPQWAAGRQKRAHVDDRGDDEEEFEVQKQLENESRRLSLRQRVSEQSAEPATRPISPLVAGPRRIASEEPRANDDDNDEAYRLMLRDGDVLAMSQEAKSNRRAVSMSAPMRRRVAWSAAETQKLLDMIADPTKGCSWIVMEREKKFDPPRDQQAIRDKARNLKALYLQSDRVLPPGFDKVALSAKERNKVVQCGRNPDRAEDDLDDDGAIINNIWAAL